MAIPTHLQTLLSKLDGTKQTSEQQWQALCPAHEDKNQSLSIGIGNDGCVLLHCFAGCRTEDVLRSIDLEIKNLFRKKDAGGRHSPANFNATLQPSGGSTLAEYAEKKKLPIDFLKNCELSDITYQGKPAVRIPYLDDTGKTITVQFRIALEGKNKFRWKKGSKTHLYGLWRLDDARKKGFVVLVEGPSDAQTLWHHDFPAIGLPSASIWDNSWASYLKDIPLIYVLIEPDRGGETVLKWLETSKICDRVRLVRLEKSAKDPSALYLCNPQRFRDTFQKLLDSAIPWTTFRAQTAQKQNQEAWKQCETLARSPSVLDQLKKSLTQRGVVGEEKVTQLIYLAVVSRLLDRPISLVLKGPSSAGKSYLVQSVLNYCPASSYYALSAMSERALAYSPEPLVHRILVIYEAVGISGEFASYLMRSLLSEGRIRYETVEKTTDGIKTKFIEREGPTGLIVTTTAIRIHPENETRLLSIPVSDSPEQTSAILKSLARKIPSDQDALKPWIALQEWLETAEHKVTIPYAEALAAEIPSIAVRLRRDFRTVLNLICAHAILHQATRSKNPNGEIIASLEDYRVVRNLVVDLIAHEIDAGVSESVRQTVEAVRQLTEGLPQKGVSKNQIAQILKLDKSTVSRRVKAAEEKGFLENLEDRKGHPAKLILGDPLPNEQVILPEPEKLKGCAVAGVGEGIEQPLLPEQDKQKEDFEERAAIQEFEGGLSRSTAEESARSSEERDPNE